jgi:low temperature requirement protein LtrA
MSEHQAEHEHRVTPLELFFDLVFVFAFTQVTSMLSHDPTWAGLGRGALVLGALWWAWTAYAWLTNTVDADEGAVRAAMLVAMGAMLIASFAVPEAFDDHGVIFGISYAIVRAMHLALYALAGRGEPDLFRAVLRMTPSSVVGSALIIAAGFVDGPVKPGLWLVALAIDYAGVLVGRGSGWRVHPAHFAERHGLIIIIAIGESIVAAGVGAAGIPLSAGVVFAAVLGLAAAAAFWMAYFDFFAITAQRVLSQKRGAAQAALARDGYSYLHLPMVGGIILFALAMKETLAHVGEDLDTVHALALCGGSALYLLAYVALRLRVSGRLSRGRFVASIVFTLLIPAATAMPALAALAVVTAVWAALHAYELLWYREARAQIRARRAAAHAS